MYILMQCKRIIIIIEYTESFYFLFHEMLAASLAVMTSDNVSV